MNLNSKALVFLIPAGLFLCVAISFILILAHPLYSVQILHVPINESNTRVSMDMDQSGKSEVTKIADKDTSGYRCVIKEKELESSCRLEIWLTEEIKDGIDLSKFQYLKLYSHFNTPTTSDFLRISFRNYESNVNSIDPELMYKYNLVELSRKELGKPIEVDFRRLIVPNWWMNKVRDQNIKSAVDLKKIHHIELATGLHATPGEYLISASKLELIREIISKEKLYEYLLIFWAASIIITFIIISIYLQFKIRQKLHNKRSLEEINESLSMRTEKLALQNITDEMTGVLNRSGMEEKLKECLNRNWFPMAIVMVDIDFFKKINDVYGHQKGDSVLINLGKILNSFIQGDESVSRFGGEEFLIILPHFEVTSLNHRLERLRKDIEAFDMELDYSVTASIGVASTSNIDGFKSIIEQADKALYQAKEEGRNCVRYFK